MQAIEVVLIAGFMTIIGSTLSWWLASRDKRAERKASASTPGVPTVQEIWVRQDRQERALDASLVLLGQSVKQHDKPGELVFSRTAIKTLRETGFMPAELEDVLTE